jgi:hypothetical protein
MRYVTMLLLILAVAPASQGRIEITPFGGHQSGGEFEDYNRNSDLEIKNDSVYGAIVGFGQEESLSQLELYFSHQESELGGTGAFSSANLFELDVDYYHIGVAVRFDRGNLQPYIVGSLGATCFDPQFSNLDSEAYFSFGLGGGVKWLPFEHVGVRLEGRVFGTFVNTEGTVYNGPNGTVAVGHTDVQFQYNAIAGLIFVIP